ncbi:MAG: tRNA adenosine(34) deaminase TadA [Amphritea sp.]
MSEPSVTDQHWMTYALELAERAADAGEVPVGAVIVSNGKVVGEGWNQPISGHDPTAHAEIMALRDAAQRLENYRLVDTTLYVTIEPCTMCAGAIVHSRVARVVFGAVEPKAGAVVSNGRVFDQAWMNHTLTYQGGVLAQACSERISAFFKQRRADQKALKRLKRSQ